MIKISQRLVSEQRCGASGPPVTLGVGNNSVD